MASVARRWERDYRFFSTALAVILAVALVAALVGLLLSMVADAFYSGGW